MVQEAGAFRRPNSKQLSPAPSPSNCGSRSFQSHLLGSYKSGAKPAATVILCILDLADLLAEPASPGGRDLLKLLITRVDVTETLLRAEVNFTELGEAASNSVTNLAAIDLPAFSVYAPLQLQRRGAELRIVLGGIAAPAPTPDPMLIRTLIAARSRTADYLDPIRALTVSDLDRGEGADVGDVSRSLQLAFLAPDLVERILDGNQPVALTAERLKRVDVPLLWEDQRAMLAGVLLFPSPSISGQVADPIGRKRHLVWWPAEQERAVRAGAPGFPALP